MTGDQYNKGNGMSGSWKKRFAIHRAASITIVVAYALVICTVDLFHDEGCMASHKHADVARVILNNDLCPTCMFLAGYNSTETSYCSTLLSTESPLISQFLPQLTVINHDEWACSIFSRAPPSITIS